MSRSGISACALLFGMVACGGGQTPTPQPSFGPVQLPWQQAYFGFASGLCSSPDQCVRAPAYNTQVPVSQAGNAAYFTVASTDAATVTGSIVMTGAGGQGSPAIQIDPRKAGSATLIVGGANGATAKLPVTITSISTMKVTLAGLPTATQLEFAVSAPAQANCPSFEGGYIFDWPVSSGGTTVMPNFPAMGSGPLSGCVFSTVSVKVMDSTNTVLAQKTFSLPIAAGKDNPSEIVLP